MKNLIFTTLLVEKSPQSLPLGAACVASAVKHDPLTSDLCNVKLISFSAEDEDYLKANSFEEKADLLANKIADKQPDFVLFSVFVWNRTILERISEILEEKGIITLAGGPEITAHPKDIKAFSYLICGEGEHSVPQIIQNLINGQKVNRINFSSAILNPETLPSPYLDGTLDPCEFGGALWELARGCPFRCSYCYEAKGEKKIRFFPMERLEKEIDLFAQKKVPQVFVLDPTYNADKNHALKMLDLIARKTPDTFYYFEARAEFIDRELAKAFSKIPCAVQIGLQSIDEEVLKKVKRSLNKKQFIKNIGYLNENGITFGLDLIYGLPSDTLKGFKEGIDFSISLYPNNLELFCLSVLPGTDLCDEAESLHLTYDKNPPYHVLHTDKFSAQDLEAARKLSFACALFYNDGRAIPWFNAVCRALRIKPSLFFKKFYDWLEQKNLLKTVQTADFCHNHKRIEELQKEFVKLLIENNTLQRFTRLAVSLIEFFGALSRTLDTGISEVLTVSYPAEALDSPYAYDFDFFTKNIRPSPQKIKTMKKGGYADYKVIRN